MYSSLRVQSNTVERVIFSFLDQVSGFAEAFLSVGTAGLVSGVAPKTSCIFFGWIKDNIYY